MLEFEEDIRWVAIVLMRMISIMTINSHKYIEASLGRYLNKMSVS